MDGTPLNYTPGQHQGLVQKPFEVVNQLRINTDNSHHRYDVLILINGVPCVQIELKTLASTRAGPWSRSLTTKRPRQRLHQTLLCFMQLFIVSNRTDTYYFANNNARHFAFNADERFCPFTSSRTRDNTKITQLDEFCRQVPGQMHLGQTISRYMVLVASEQSC